MKNCQSCKIDKDEADFPVRNDRSGRLRPYCKSCSLEIAKARYQYHKESNPFLHKTTRAKSRSQHLKVPFDLDPEYLKDIWTGICPVFKIEINLSTDRSDESAAELDRFIPEKGYVKGNVSFISRKANRLKNSASISDLENLLEWMKNFENSKHKR